MQIYYAERIRKLCGPKGKYMLILKRDFVNKVYNKIIRKFDEVIRSTADMYKGIYKGKVLSLFPDGIIIISGVSSDKELEDFLKNLVDIN